MKDFIHFTQPLFGEEEKNEVLNALDSGWVTLGPRTKQFEDEFASYIGTKHAIAVSSCTAGLHLSLIAAGIGKGDEVITTPFTFVATTNTIVQVGAKPVFVDIEENTFNIDPLKIEEKITAKTKAIMPVHYAGLSVDMDSIMKIAKKHKLVVIEDAAHGTGAFYKGKKIGSIGDMSNFSFHPVKNMSTGDGGMITTDNDNYAEKLRMLRLHGMSKDAWKRHTATGTWKYDVEIPGFKYNMTDISAALGIHQLKKLDGFIAKRKEYAKKYDEAFAEIPEITVPYIPEGEEHIYSLYTIKINTEALKISRDDIVEELKKANIGTSVYFIPLHYFTYYKNSFGLKKGDLPISEKVFEQIVSLPLYPKMTTSDVAYVIDTLREIIVKNRRNYSWSIDQFDTDIFGFNVAKIKALYANGDSNKIQKIVTKLNKELKEQNINYAVYRIPAVNYPVIHALESNGWVMVDSLVSLQADLVKEVYDIDKHIRKASDKDEKALKNIAANAFNLTRVYNDKNLDPKKAGKMYAQWVENSLKGKVADAVLVWEEKGIISGFITVQKNGHIPLVAVLENGRGKGIGKALVFAALNEIKKWGVKTSAIETQMANIPAVRAYQACGFKVVKSHLTFRWTNQSNL